jgi:RimJ/RimL family protein N-acetyltransferase
MAALRILRGRWSAISLLFLPRGSRGENMSRILETERLLLRPPRAADISHFVRLLNDFEVSKNLSRVPYPYTEDDACDFVVRSAHGWRSGEDMAFAILTKAPGACIGACGLHPRAGLGIRLLARPAQLETWLCHRSGPPLGGFCLRRSGRRKIGGGLVSRQSGLWAGAGEARLPFPTAKITAPASRAGVMCSAIRSC